MKKTKTVDAKDDKAKVHKSLAPDNNNSERLILNQKRDNFTGGIGYENTIDSWQSRGGQGTRYTPTQKYTIL